MTVVACTNTNNPCHRQQEGSLVTVLLAGSGSFAAIRSPLRLWILPCPELLASTLYIYDVSLKTYFPLRFQLQDAPHEGAPSWMAMCILTPGRRVARQASPRIHHRVIG